MGARQCRGEEPVRPAVHVRLRDLPRRPPGPARDVHGHRLAGRRLLQGRRQAGDVVALGAVHPRRSRRHGCGEDRRELCRFPGGSARGDRPRLRPGGLPRRPGVPLHRGARRHEHVLRVRRRPHRHPRDRHDPRGDHPRVDHRARRQAGPLGRGAEVRDRRVARRRRERQRSPRSSPAGPPRWSPRSGPSSRRAETSRRRPARTSRCGSAKRSWACSSVAPRIPSAGCIGSAEARSRVGTLSGPQVGNSACTRPQQRGFSRNFAPNVRNGVPSGPPHSPEGMWRYDWAPDPGTGAGWRKCARSLATGPSSGPCSASWL